MIPLAEAPQGATLTLPYNEAPQGSTSMHQYKDDQGRWEGEAGYTGPRGSPSAQPDRPRLAETSRPAAAGQERALSAPNGAPSTANVQSEVNSRSSSTSEREPGPPVFTTTPPEPVPVPPRPRPQIITNPSWARAPQALMPERALSRGIETGSATLECTVQPNGSLSRCNIVSETPSGAGFGQAAAQAAARARISPRTVDGLAPGGSVRFTLPFSTD